MQGGIDTEDEDDEDDEEDSDVDLADEGASCMAVGLRLTL